jgi:hypothetical protein
LEEIEKTNSPLSNLYAFLTGSSVTLVDADVFLFDSGSWAAVAILFVDTDVFFLIAAASSVWKVCGN